MVHELLVLVCRGALVASGALLLVLMLRVPARRWLGAAFAYRLWLLVPAAGLATFLPAPVRPLIPALQIASSVPAIAAPVELTATVAKSAPIDWQPYLFALWISGTLVFVAVFVRQQRRYVKNLGTLSASDDDTLRAQATAGCPALIGALRPRVVLPSDFELRYTPRERELVLAHERTHLARGDAQINAFAALLRCLNWFNPIFHFAASRFRFDQEIACDAAVMSRFPEARRPYADAMLKAQLVGESRQELRLPAGCHWPSSHPLKERIIMLKFPILKRSQRMAASAALAALALIAGFASWAAQPGTMPESSDAAKNTAASDAAPQTVAPAEIQGYRLMHPPKYPAEAVRDRVSAMVMLKVAVDDHGVPTSAEVESVKPEQSTRVLADAAIATAMQWRFKPGMQDGKPVSGFVKVPVDFLLSDDTGKPLPPIEPASKDVSVSYRKMTQPVYTPGMITTKIDGTLYVRVRVGSDGSVLDAYVDQSLPMDALVLKDFVISAIKKWQFNPAIRNGQAVESEALVPFRIQADGESGGNALEPAYHLPEPTYPDYVRRLDTISFKLAAS